MMSICVPRGGNYSPILLSASLAIVAIKQLALRFEAELVVALFLRNAERTENQLWISERSLADAMTDSLSDENFPYARRVRQLFMISDLNLGLNFELNNFSNGPNPNTGQVNCSYFIFGPQLIYRGLHFLVEAGYFRYRKTRKDVLYSPTTKLFDSLSEKIEIRSVAG